MGALKGALRTVFDLGLPSLTASFLVWLTSRGIGSKVKTPSGRGEQQRNNNKTF